MKQLDDVDRHLLLLVQKDAKLSYADLGERVGLSISSVMERLKRLQTEGAITGYHAVIDPAAVDLALCAYVQVAFDRPANEPSFLERIATIAECVECHHITGDFSYLLKVRVRDTAHLEELLRSTIRDIRGITRTHTLVVLSTHKETTVIPTGATGAPRKKRI